MFYKSASAKRCGSKSASAVLASWFWQPASHILLLMNCLRPKGLIHPIVHWLWVKLDFVDQLSFEYETSLQMHSWKSNPSRLGFEPVQKRSMERWMINTSTTELKEILSNAVVWCWFWTERSYAVRRSNLVYAKIHAISPMIYFFSYTTDIFRTKNWYPTDIFKTWLQIFR